MMNWLEESFILFVDFYKAFDSLEHDLLAIPV